MHVSSIHEGIRDETNIFKCKQCDFTAQKKLDLILHAASDHSGFLDESDIFKNKK